MLAFHCRHAADMTVACMEVPVEEATAFGVMTVDEHQRVVEIYRKAGSIRTRFPASPDALW